MTNEIICPYCGYEFTDSWECNPSEDGVSMEVECESCEETFICMRNVEISYTSWRLEEEANE